MVVERTRHAHRQRPLSGEDFGHLGAGAEVGNEVAWSKAGLLHAELDGRDRRREPHRDVLLLVVLDQIDEHIEFVARRSARRRAHERVNAFERSTMVRLGSNRLDAHLRPP